MINNKANTIGTAALVLGIFYGMRQKKGIGITAAYGIGFGLVGLVLGKFIAEKFDN